MGYYTILIAAIGEDPSGMLRGARVTTFGRYRPLRCPANGSIGL